MAKNTDRPENIGEALEAGREAKSKSKTRFHDLQTVPVTLLRSAVQAARTDDSMCTIRHNNGEPIRASRATIVEFLAGQSAGLL